MKLNYIVLNNFKTFIEETNISFEDGLNLIVAENGSGKSSIIDAIRLLLFNINNKKMESFINWNRKSNSFTIELDFNHLSNHYNTTLIYEKSGKTGKADRELYLNDELIAKDSDVVKELAKIFDPVLTDNSLFSLQSENQIVNNTDSERRDVIKKIKNLDYTKYVKEEIEPVIEKLEYDIVKIEKEIFALENTKYFEKETQALPFSTELYNKKIQKKENLQKIITLYNDKVNELDNKKELLNNLLNENKSRIFTEGEKETQIEDIKKKVDTINNSIELSDLKNEIGGLETEIVNNELHEFTNDKIENLLNDIEHFIKKINFLSQECKTTIDNNFDNDETIQKYIKYIDTHNFNISSFSNSISVTKKNLEETQKKIDNIILERIPLFDDTKMKELERLQTTLKYDISNCQKNIEKVLSGVCLTCNRPYEQSDIDKYEKKLEELNNELSICVASLGNEECSLIEYNKSIEENNNNKELHSELTKRKLELENIISNKENELVNEQKNLKDTEEGLKEYKEEYEEKINVRIESYKTGIEQKQEMIDVEQKYIQTSLVNDLNNKKELYVIKEKNIKETLETLSNNYNELLKDILSIRESIDKNNKEINKLSTEIESYTILDIEKEKNELSIIEESIILYDKTILLNKERELHNATIKQSIIDDIKELDKKNKKRIDILDEKNNYESSRTILLKDFPNYVISQSIQGLQDDMNQTVDNIYYKSLDVEFKQTKSSIALNYGTGVKKVGVKSGASGAEKQIIQIAFISSFNKRIGLNCIIIDEPDSNLSDENAERLYESLGEMNSIYGQMFVITHKKVMQEYLTNNYEANIISL